MQKMTSTERYHHRRADGACPRCGKIPDGDYVFCQPCRWKRKRTIRNYLKSGKCLCGSPRAEGYRSCLPCIANRKRQRTRYRAAGLCWCGRKPKTGCRTCVKCISRGIRRRQGGSDG